ncbi:hypothetical protein BVC80_9065g60 [Macleaya cordata]|uniref:Uncharacterized protein n=1 Tax=Macleaya cordata TaxID=56857 RepID=A0A200PNJ4_MACCD|nr:hypothetical protein BVC80_9065g60 [Macleaya cordata]
MEEAEQSVGVSMQDKEEVEEEDDQEDLQHLLEKIDDKKSDGESSSIKPEVPYEHNCSAALPAISKVEAEMLDEERFLLKIVFNKVMGAVGQVQRIVEMLGLEIINVSICEEFDQDNMQSSNILRVKKKGVASVVTEENLLNRVKTTAKQLGGLLLPSNS